MRALSYAHSGTPRLECLGVPLHLVRCRGRAEKPIIRQLLRLPQNCYGSRGFFFVRWGGPGPRGARTKRQGTRARPKEHCGGSGWGHPVNPHIGERGGLQHKRVPGGVGGARGEGDPADFKPRMTRSERSLERGRSSRAIGGRGQGGEEPLRQPTWGGGEG